MKKLACLLVILSLGIFAVGCGGKDEKKEEKKESEKKDAAGKGVKVEEGGKKEVDPSDIQLGGENKDPADDADNKDPADNADTKDPGDDGENKDIKIPDPIINPPTIDPPKVDPSAIDEKEAGEAADKEG